MGNKESRPFDPEELVWYCAKHDRRDRLEKLFLSHGEEIGVTPSLCSWKDPKLGRTALIVACQKNHLHIVDRLLSITGETRGDIVNESDRQHAQTALHYAAKYHHVQIVRRLLQHPLCDPLQVDGKQRSALDLVRGVFQEDQKSSAAECIRMLEHAIQLDSGVVKYRGDTVLSRFVGSWFRMSLRSYQCKILKTRHEGVVELSLYHYIDSILPAYCIWCYATHGPTFSPNEPSRTTVIQVYGFEKQSYDQEWSQDLQLRLFSFNVMTRSDIYETLVRLSSDEISRPLQPARSNIQTNICQEPTTQEEQDFQLALALSKMPNQDDLIAPPSAPEMDQDSCIVCFDGPIETVCVPCGHVALCLECAEVCQESDARSCPVCRQNIEQIVRMFHVN